MAARVRRVRAGALAAIALTSIGGCGDAGSPPGLLPATAAACTGVQLPATPDLHCTGADGQAIRTPVAPLACAAAAGGSSAAAGSAAGDASGAIATIEADDVDCKYHVVLQPVCGASARDLSFRATIASRVDGAAAANAGPWIEAVLPPLHPAPNTTLHSPEPEPGTYLIGPVRFDASGRWSLTMHMYQLCPLAADSPHSHVDLSVDVP